jgi:hypothetical protein
MTTMILTVSMLDNMPITAKPRRSQGLLTVFDKEFFAIFAVSLS